MDNIPHNPKILRLLAEAKRSGQGKPTIGF
jgi:hypothetical protein